MNEYKKYKLSELFSLLENNKIIEMKNENGFIAFIKYDDESNLLIKYRDSTNWCYLQDSANHLVKSEFRVIKTISEQIKNIAKKYGYIFCEITNNRIVFATKKPIWRCGLSFDSDNVKTVSIDHPEGYSFYCNINMINEIFQIYKDNNYSFEEEKI